jgi:CO/xanthine dehydrogenase Mo-binding subunit
MLCVYQALRDLIAQAADRTGIDPDRISFNSALDAARRSAGTAPPPADQARDHLLADLTSRPIRRREGRTNHVR